MLNKWVHLIQHHPFYIWKSIYKDVFVFFKSLLTETVKLEPTTIYDCFLESWGQLPHTGLAVLKYLLIKRTSVKRKKIRFGFLKTFETSNY